VIGVVPVQVPLVIEYLVEVVPALTVGALLAPSEDPVTNESAGALVFVGAETTAWLLTVKRVTGALFVVVVVPVAVFVAVTLSVRNLPNCVMVGVKVIAVAPVIAVQPVGVVETTVETRLVQLNHW
jgi:hypothetical protein